MLHHYCQNNKRHRAAWKERSVASHSNYLGAGENPIFQRGAVKFFPVLPDRVCAKVALFFLCLPVSFLFSLFFCAAVERGGGKRAD